MQETEVNNDVNLNSVSTQVYNTRDLADMVAEIKKKAKKNRPQFCQCPRACVMAHVLDGARTKPCPTECCHNWRLHQKNTITPEEEYDLDQEAMEGLKAMRSEEHTSELQSP